MATRRGRTTRVTPSAAFATGASTGAGGSLCDVSRAGRKRRRTLNLYLDASALVKRYVAEAGTDLVHEVMQDADTWITCRTAYVETMRAVGLAAGRRTMRRVHDEWDSFAVIEVDQALVEHASSLALDHDLRSLDSLHLAAALVLPPDDLVVATWDRRLHAAIRSHRLRLLPDDLR